MLILSKREKMNQKLINTINDIRDDAADLQAKVDAIERIPNLTAGEKQMAKEAGNNLRGFRGFALSALASAAGIEKFEMEPQIENNKT